MLLSNRAVFAGLLVVLLSIVSSDTHAAAAAPVSILTPAGGEFYVVGTSQRVRLDPKTRAKSVTIELSVNGGTTFTPLGTINNTVKDKTARNILPFTVPNTPSGNCVVRATAGTVSSVSPGFSIGAAGVVASAAASNGDVLTADGLGGASFSTLVGKFVKVAGDTMTGALTLSAAPTQDLHAATKQYVDAETAARTTADAAESTRATAAETALETTKVAKAGDTMTGALNISSTTTNPRMSLTAANSSFDFQIDGNGLRVLRNFGVNSTPIFTCDPTNNNVRVGGNGAMNLDGVGSVRVDGSLALEANTFANDFTANASTCVFFCNSANNNITITLPAPSGTTGRIYIIKKVAAANSVTIQTNGGAIEGATSVTLTGINAFRFLISNGTNWFILSQ